MQNIILCRNLCMPSPQLVHRPRTKPNTENHYDMLDLVGARSRTPGFRLTREQDRQHRYSLQLRGKLSDPKMNAQISRTNQNSTQKSYICPSAGGWPTSCPVTPYYSLEHGGMLEYALRVTIIATPCSTPGKFEYLCAIFYEFEGILAS